MYQTAVSRKEFEEELEWEKKKHPFFMRYYYLKGYEVLEDWVDKGNHPYDVKVKTPTGEIKFIDEKARKKDYGDCLIEILQCLRKGRKGWLHTEEVTEVLYASWTDQESFEPNSFYSIDRKKLLDYVCNNYLKLKDNPLVQSGFGLTANKISPWGPLLQQNIAKRI